MCGIVGTFAFQELPENNSALTRGLAEMMRRRGPDDEGFWSDQSISLGFRRLSILDLSRAANQPMFTADGRHALLYNGEVYNFQDLRRELQSAGVQFHSSGDTEVVLYALAVWGKKALERFDGMFALAFYDVKEKRILLARDYAGMKPLYYLSSGSGVVFASQYDALMAHPWAASLPVSLEALSLYFRFGYIHPPRALLQNTHMLESGAWLEADKSGRIRQGRFFEFPQYPQPDLQGNEAYEAVDAAITTAVRRQLISDVPVGAFLSGGIDSPLIASKMKLLSDRPVQTFTLATGGDRFDESGDAAAYAKEIGLENNIYNITADLAQEMLEDVVAACGEPFSDYSLFPTMLVSRLAGEKVKVLLSGDGGDELFWGYWERFALIIDKLPEYSQPYWYRYSRNMLKRRWGIGKSYGGKQWPSIGRWYRKIHSRIPENRIRQIFPEGYWPADFKLFHYSGNDGNVDRTAHWMRWNEFNGFLSMVLLKVDRASMYHSMEVRIPLLDREVLDVALRINWNSCMDFGKGLGKLPLRYALSRSIAYQTHKKRGFTIPLGNWLRGKFKPLFEDLVLGRKEILGYPWNRHAIQELFDEHLSGRENYTWGLWLLMNLALWEDRHFKGRTRNF